VMGAGVSSTSEILNDLTSDEKALITRNIEGKYAQYDINSVVDEKQKKALELEIFKSLREELQLSQELVKKNRSGDQGQGPGPGPGPLVLNAAGELVVEATSSSSSSSSSAGKQKQLAREESLDLLPLVDATMVPDIKIDVGNGNRVDKDQGSDKGKGTEAGLAISENESEGEANERVMIDYYEESEEMFDAFDPAGGEAPATLTRNRVYSQSSHDLLSDATAGLLEDQSMIADFIGQLQGGGVGSPQTSAFRARRLTYSTAHEDVVGGGAMGMGGSGSFSVGGGVGIGRQSPTATIIKKDAQRLRRRTTIYSSAEIGVKQEKRLPFPTNILGTFSCHGIEPSRYDPDEDAEGSEDGITQKDNQDRGCVVHPFRNNQKDSLLLVLDGHGAQGDSVSEFAMRQIVVTLERNDSGVPSLDTDPEGALKEAFVKTNAALMVTPFNYMTSGTTCVAVYMKETHFWVAHVGDSRAVLAVVVGGQDGKVRTVTVPRT